MVDCVCKRKYVGIGGGKVSDDLNIAGKNVLPDQTTNHPEPRRIKGFFGAYNHSVDAKGRMIVPQSFRERLGDDIVIGLNMAQTSIAIYPYEVWEKKVSMLTELRDQDVRAEKFLDRFSRFSFDNVSFDSQGRVLLPAALREMYLREAASVQISGANDYVKVVSGQQAAEETRDFHTEHPDVLSEISKIQESLRGKQGS